MALPRMRRTVRIGVVALLLALVVYSFLGSGSASARSTGQISSNQASNQSLTLKSCSSNTVSLVPAKTFYAFTCHAMTIKLGTPVVFVNRAGVGLFVANFALNTFVLVHNSSTATMQIPQTGQFHLLIYNSSAPGAQLFVTVVS